MRSYRSRAVATMQKTPKGLAITEVEVSIRIELEDAAFAEEARKAVALAEKNCPVSASLTCPVKIELSVS
jgi:organic hydroperoxide reductase OsmC/OhrA